MFGFPRAPGTIRRGAHQRRLALLIAALLEARGYRLVSLNEALADPAYGRPDEYVGPRGLSWLQRWALAVGVHVPPEPREPVWVTEMFRSS